YLNPSLTLDVRVEVSSLASADQVTRGQPLVRQMVLSGRTLVVPDRPVVIGSVDDPNSKREFQLDVTLTNLKRVAISSVSGESGTWHRARTGTVSCSAAGPGASGS